jgi:hypothetical protein
MLLDTALHTLLAQAVAFLDSQGKERLNFSPQPFENAPKKCGRGDAIDIVIAKNDDALFFVNRFQEPLDRRAQIRKQKGIGKRLKPGLKKLLRQGHRGEASLTQQFRNQRMQVEVFSQLRSMPGWRKPAPPFSGSA